MANRLMELESSISHCRKKKHNEVNKNKPATSRSLSRRHRAVHALNQPVNYQVPGIVPAMQQRDSMACWATVFTMMSSWKHEQSMTVETALSEVGQKWLNIYNSQTGLFPNDKVEFVAAAGLVAEAPQNFSVDGWEQLLRNYGPLWVTTDEAKGKPWAIHARVITAIQGDGTPSGTTFTMIDPNGGKEYKEKISVFIPKYEEEVTRTGYMRMQVLHWPRDAKLSQGKSYESADVLSFERAMKQAGVSGTETQTDKAIVTPSPQKPLVPTTTTPSAPVNLDALVAKLISEGADQTALMAFLKEIKAPVTDLVSGQSAGLPIGGEQINTHMPSAVVLDGAEATAFRAAIKNSLLTAPAGATLAKLFDLLPAIADKYQVTIGVGPAVAGDYTAENSFDAGVLFAQNNKIGFYGPAGNVITALAKIVERMQITVIKGEASNFGGAVTLVDVSVPSGVTPINGKAILAKDRFTGVTAQVSVSADVSPFESLAKFQYTSSSLSLDEYARQTAAPLFGIAGLTAVEAVNIGLASVSIVQTAATQDGGLVYNSDQASRLLTTEARNKMGVKSKTSYSYPLLWVGEIKRGFADVLFDVKWEGNKYGEIAGARVIRNIHKSTSWDKSTLNVKFKRITTLPPPSMSDPREWPIVFEYEGTFDPYGNGHFTFQGQFAINAFGGLKNLKHEISDKSFASFLKIGKKEEYVRTKPDQSYTVPKIPADQLAYLKEKLGI